MKIALVHSYYSSMSPSGENITVDAQAEALRTAGYEVEIVAQRTDTLDELTLYPVRAALAASGMMGPSPVQQLEAFGPDVVHVHNLFPNWGSRWMDKWNGPIVSTLHNYRTVCANGIMWRDGSDCSLCIDGTSFNALRHKCYRKSTVATVPLAFATRQGGAHSRMLQQSDVVVTLNTASLHMFRSVVGPKTEVTCIPNFARDSGNKLLRNQHSRVWAFVGRLTEEKGILWLLENWPPEEQLIIAGSGPLEEIVRRAADGSHGSIRFLGKLDQDVLERELAACEGLILPSTWSEGIPTVALESLKLGLSIISSTKCAAGPELTADGAGGTFDLSDGLLGIRKSLIEVRSHGLDASVLARANYERRFSERIWLQKMGQIYRSLAS